MSWRQYRAVEFFSPATRDLRPALALIHSPNHWCHLLPQGTRIYLRCSPYVATAGRSPRALPCNASEEILSGMMHSLAATEVNFLALQSTVFCVECELLSENNTSRCLACGSKAVLSLSRVLGGSLRGQQTAHLIADAELDRLVRSLLGSVTPLPSAFEDEIGPSET